MRHSKVTRKETCPWEATYLLRGKTVQAIPLRELGAIQSGAMNSFPTSNGRTNSQSIYEYGRIYDSRE